MSDVRRFRINCVECPDGGPDDPVQVDDPNGWYVEYDDYKALASRLSEALKARDFSEQCLHALQEKFGAQSRELVGAMDRLDAVLDVIHGYRLALAGKPADPHYMDQASMLSAIATVVERGSLIDERCVKCGRELLEPVERKPGTDGTICCGCALKD